MLLIGSRHRRDSCSEAYRFARSEASRPTRRSTAPSGLLSWGSSIAPPPTQPSLRPLPVQAVTQTSARDCQVPSVFRSCRSSRLQRFPPQPSRSEDPLVRRSAGLLHPAAGHGVHQVSNSLPYLSEEPDPKVVDPKVRGKSSPVANTLRSVPLLGSLEPCRHRVSSFRTRSRSPTGVPSRRSEPRPLPCRHGALRCSPTSGLSSAEESVAMRATLPLRARSMLPWALDRLVPDAAARFALPSVAAGRFAWRPEPLRRPPTRTSGEGRVFRPCLAPATRCRNRPRREIAAGRRGSGNSRRSRLGRTPSCLTECQWIRPERKVHRVGPVTRRCWVADVIATHLRRDSFATQCSLRRAATGGSSSCSPSFRGCPRT
jgi:hypothetical protein